MKNRIISKSQIEDATAVMRTAADRALSNSEQNAGAYVPEKTVVPRPAYSLFQTRASAIGGLLSKEGRIWIGPSQSQLLQSFVGLRGIASYQQAGKSGTVRTVTGPAIVLAAGTRISMLIAETEPETIHELQQAMLEQEYLKDLVTVSDRHRNNDVTNAGSLAPALMIASTTTSTGAHGELHSMAANQQFGTNFMESGRQRIRFGRHGEYAPISTIRPLSNVLFRTGPADQQPAQAQLMDVALTPSELAVGMALAAATSRGLKPDITANLQTMVRS